MEITNLPAAAEESTKRQVNLPQFFRFCFLTYYYDVGFRLKYKQDTLLQYRNKAVFILKSKKINKEDLKYYRTMGLPPLIYKMFTKILSNRIKQRKSRIQRRTPNTLLDQNTKKNR